MATAIAMAAAFGDRRRAGGDGKRPRKQWRVWSLKRDRYLTPEQVRDVLLPAARKIPDERIWMLLYVTANTGGRIGEVVQLRARDLHATEPVLSLVTLKREGHPVRELRLTDSVCSTIRDWIARRNLGPDGWLFQSRQGGGHISKARAGQLFTLVAASCGLKVWQTPGHKGNGLHALRHANALAWMANLAKVPGKSALDMLLTIGARLGHSSMRSTLTYLHPSQDTQSVDAVGEITDTPKPPTD
jgi:integrase